MPDDRRETPVPPWRLAFELAGTGMVAAFVFWATVVWLSSVVLALALVAGWLLTVLVVGRRRPYRTTALLALSFVTATECLELALHSDMLPGGRDYRPAAQEAEWGRTRIVDTKPTLRAADQQLGYRLAGSRRARSTLTKDKALIYDVVYTIEDSGFRATPGAPVDGRAVLLMGDSFQFGDGLEDDQTLAFHLASRSAGEFRPVNLGTPGYGPHQVLRQLQLGVPLVSGTDHMDFLFLNILDQHIRRASGKAHWLRDSPRYEVSTEGVVLAGVFRPSSKFMDKLVEDSAVLALLGEALDRYRSSDQKRFVAILREIQAEAKARYGARLLVLYYPEQAVVGESGIAELFCRAGVPFIDVVARLPITPESAHKYYIPGDGHPTSELNSRVA